MRLSFHCDETEFIDGPVLIRYNFSAKHIHKQHKFVATMLSVFLCSDDWALEVVHGSIQYEFLYSL